MRLHRIHARPGFTLIELLVVIGLILVLVGITVSISSSGLIDSHRTVGAGDRASGWLIIARSKAQREGAPRGVRFIRDAGNPSLIKEAQYLEVPDPYTPQPNPLSPTIRPLITLADDGAGNRTATVNLSTINIGDLIANVEAGDTLSLPDFRVLVRITGAIPPSGVIPVSGTFLPQFGGNTQVTTSNFGFIRKARPMLGEPILQITGDNAIDASLSQFAPGSDPSVIDILFAPNGEVIGTTQGKTILWIRNPTFSPTFATTFNRSQYEQAGQMGLIAVYTKTGAISTHPVALPQGSATAVFGSPTTEPYQFANDGRSSGL